MKEPLKTFSKKEIALMKSLETPAKVQDFLNTLKFNFEKDGESLSSPLFTIRKKEAHCLEGAILGAYILSVHKFPPLIVHLESTPDDFDHVIAPFQIDGLWGALSKTNHAVLRYREPVYRDIRELVMSYFHEYFLNNGKKTLRRYSRPLNLKTFGENWMQLEGDLWNVDQRLDQIKHYDIMSKSMEKKLRKAEKIEQEAGKITQYKQ